jgi:adenosylhomocysteine nucleosidase
MNIAITAAHALEFSTFRRYMGRVQKMALDSWSHYLWQHQGNQVILLETGIGPEKAEAALSCLLKAYRIDCVINFGSAGMISRDFSVGDAFLVTEIADVISRNVLKTDAAMTEAIGSFLAEEEIVFHRGRLATSPEPVVKCPHRLRLAQTLNVGAVDMEAYALCRLAQEKGVPFASLKMISDRANAMTRLEFWKNLPHVERTLGKLIYGFLEYLKAA